MGADLFAWEAERTAEQAVALAHARQEEARRRAAWPPHGLKKAREDALRQATAEALKAEAALSALRTEARA
ncbi:hypothetical protein D3C71_314710 [compost metagenome]